MTKAKRYFFEPGGKTEFGAPRWYGIYDTKSGGTYDIAHSAYLDVAEKIVEALNAYEKK